MEKVMKGSQKATVWDCGSSLYDSFELKSFERQLDSAISSARSLSMPHLTDTRRFPTSRPHQTHDDPPQILSKKTSKISRSFNKLMRTLFRTKQSPSTLFRVQSQRGHDRVYDRYGALTTIPEVSENANPGDYEGGFSPEMRSTASSLAERSTSERFAATSVGISCA
ncbi:uncharacterized protein LOC141679435 [Apium graveolens]|uniref:uncharacterized protein LOC141679435 n=1 Tax=Apium graveolens TaxID=4045 RepID=UPI003D7B4A92